MEGRSQMQNLEPTTSSSIITSYIDELASAFFAAECHMNFQQRCDDQYEFATYPLSSPVPGPIDAEMPPCQSSGDNIFTESGLQSTLNPDSCSNQNKKSCEKFQKSLSTIDMRGNEFLSRDDQIKKLGDDATLLIGSNLELHSDIQNNLEVSSFLPF